MSEFCCITMEYHAMDATVDSPFDIAGIVVDEDTFFSLEGECLQHQMIKFSFRFEEVYIRGDQSAIKQFLSRYTVPVIRLSQGGVGEQIDAITCILQFSDQPNHAVNGKNRTILLSDTMPSMLSARPRVGCCSSRIGRCYP